eukprot:gene8301-biopygen4605
MLESAGIHQFTVLFCTRMEMPVSTTHCCVGAVVGVGITQGRAAVQWATFAKMAGAWLVTVPAGALVSAAFLGFIRPALLTPGPMYP